MALPTPVQSAVNNSAAATIAATYGSGTTAGNLLIAVVGTTNPNSPVFPSSVTDNQSQTWALLDTDSQATSGLIFGSLAVYYKANTAAGVTTVTANGTSGATTCAIIILEYPLSGTAPLDQHIINAGSGGSAASGSTGTTAQANELQIAYCLALATATVSMLANSPSGNSVSESNSGNSMIIRTTDALLSSVGTVAASATVSGSSVVWSCGTSTWLIGSPTQDSTFNELMLLGVGS